MKKGLTTYQLFKLRYKGIQLLGIIHNQDNELITKYLVMLKLFDEKCKSMDFHNGNAARIENTIIIPIANNIIDEYRQYIPWRNEEIHKDVIEKIKRETVRIANEINRLDSLNGEFEYTMTRDDALDILLSYMDVEDIKYDYLTFYPLDEEELQEKNRYKKEQEILSKNKELIEENKTFTKKKEKYVKSKNK